MNFGGAMSPPKYYWDIKFGVVFKEQNCLLSFRPAFKSYSKINLFNV